MSNWYAIEFRNGSYLISLESPIGGRLRDAKLFCTRAEAEEFAKPHEWIWLNGGMIVDVTEKRKAFSIVVQ